MYDGKSTSNGSALEHTGKETYFRDVHLFIERARDLAVVKGAALVRENLWMSLRGTALEWWTAELSATEKRITKLGDGIDEWATLLGGRFKEPATIAIDAVLRERYTMRDAISRREPREYAQKILRAAKDADFTAVKNQLDIIYNGIDLELRRDVKKPEHGTTINAFLTALDECKHEWWMYASRHGGRNAGSGLTSQGSRQQNRPADNRGNYNQFQSRQQGPGFGQQPFYGRQSYQPYYQPFPSRQFNNSNAYQPQQQQQYGQSSSQQPPRQQGLPPPRQPLQITAPPNASGSTSSNRPQAGNGFPRREDRGNQGQGFQRPWQQRNGGYRQKAYQASADENEEDLPPQEDEYDKSQGTYQTEHSEHEDPQEENGEFESFEPFDSTSYFTEAAPEIHSCRHCTESFASRNALFRHLKEVWKEPRHASEVFEVTEAPQVAEDSSTAAPDETRKVIESSSKDSGSTPGYAFRGFHYAITNLKPTPESEAMPSCADSGAGITLLDRTQCQKFFPSTKISKMASPIRVRGLGSAMHSTDEFVTVTTYADGELPDGTPAVAKMTMEAHLVDNLKANMLIGNDVLVPQKIRLDPAGGKMVIGACQDLAARIEVVTKKDPGVRRAIRSKGTVTIPALSTVSVPVTYRGTLPDDRDFLFEPQFKQNLGREGGVFAHVVDSSLSFVQLRNASDRPARISRRSRLGSVVEFQEEGCYLATPEAAPLAAGGWMLRKPKQSWKSRIAKGLLTVAAGVAAYTTSGSLPRNENPGSSTSTPASTTVDPAHEHVLSNGITIYGSTQEEAFQIAAVAMEFPEIWTDQGTTVDIPEEEWMPIPLKPGVDSKPSRVYPLGQKDKEIIDETFDKLHQQGKMTWSNQPTKYSYPCFVVWRDTPSGRKGRVVVDIRGLNKITESDSYPMPLQSDIISSVAGYRYISIVDATGWFHQFLVKILDRHKLTIVSHRGQEQSNVALMGYKGSPPYVQRQTDKMLRPFQDFAKAYVDDMIAFSRTLAEHLEHLRKLFTLFRERRVSLNPQKSFLGYPSVTLLGQHVDSLGMSTSADKIRAIKALGFPRSLRDLEIYLGLTGWLRSSIHRYAQIAKPLQERKTRLTRELPTKEGSQASGPARKRQSTKLPVDDPTEAEIQAYQRLQKAFDSPIFLVHFDRSRRLYIDIDSSKSWGFAAMVYHVKGDPELDENSTIARTSVQPIMFLASFSTKQKRTTGLQNLKSQVSSGLSRRSDT